MKFIKTSISITLISLMSFFTFSVQADVVANSVTAVNGYDVVSYHTAKKPLRGNGHYLAVHDGVTYLFSSEANQKTFQAAPGKYAPAFGGYCAFGVSVGKKFVGDPEVWRVIDGKLYLNLDVNIQSDWLKDVPGRIKTANEKWKTISNKTAASL